MMDQKPPLIDAILAQIDAPSLRTVSAAELVKMLQLFDDAALFYELKEFSARCQGDPAEKIVIVNRLTHLMREAERLKDRRESQRGLIGQIAAGGGTGLIVGGVVAVLNPAIGSLALLAVGGGAVMGIVAWASARRLDDERSVSKQIAERVCTLLKVIEP